MPANGRRDLIRRLKVNVFLVGNECEVSVTRAGYVNIWARRGLWKVLGAFVTLSASATVCHFDFEIETSSITTHDEKFHETAIVIEDGAWLF